MNLAAIYHRTDENYCYALDEDRVLIALKTGYDIDRVVLYQGDPFTHGIAGSNQRWSGEPVEVEKCIELKYHKLWQAVLEPKHKRIRYYFELYSGDECVCMMEDDFYTKESLNCNGATGQFFMFPWLNPSDVVKVPEWTKNTVWYQIFPERFCNGNPKRNNKYVKPWKYERVGGADWYGGDLEGIISKLDYLCELGINGIYLNPIFLANSNHKYETIDYEIVDPGFGDDEVLRELVDKAHSLGIRVMLDGVFNHCGYMNEKFIDVCEKGPESKWFDWFFINKWPFDRNSKTDDGRFFSFAFFAGMPKLNTNNPEVVKYFIDVCSGWIDKYDIDGIRVDVGNEVAHTFLKQLNSALKAKKEDFYLIGELWHDSETWLKGDEYDAVMNYPLVNSVLSFWTKDNFTNKDFEYAINRCYNLYRRQQMEVAFNLFDSHDTDRIMNRVKGNVNALYQQMTFLFTMAGSPCMYYGTEIGMKGGFDPDCRRCMPWDDIESGKYDDRLSFIKKVIKLRKETRAFRCIDIEYVYDYENDKVLHYIKSDGEEKYHIIINCSNKAVEIKVAGERCIENKFNSNQLLPDGVVVIREEKSNFSFNI